MGDRKAVNILATGAQVLVTANPGCLMQVATALDRQGQQIALAHTMQVLDASICGTPIDGTGVRGSRGRGSRPRRGGVRTAVPSPNGVGVSRDGTQA